MDINITLKPTGISLYALKSGLKQSFNVSTEPLFICFAIKPPKKMIVSEQIIPKAFNPYSHYSLFFIKKPALAV
jgi:hypothetical protein